MSTVSNYPALTQFINATKEFGYAAKGLGYEVIVGEDGLYGNVSSVGKASFNVVKEYIPEQVVSDTNEVFAFFQKELGNAYSYSKPYVISGCKSLISETVEIASLANEAVNSVSDLAVVRATIWIGLAVTTRAVCKRVWNAFTAKTVNVHHTGTVDVSKLDDKAIKA